jgi:hypothetical protein
MTSWLKKCHKTDSSLATLSAFDTMSNCPGAFPALQHTVLMALTASLLNNKTLPPEIRPHSLHNWFQHTGKRGK